MTNFGSVLTAMVTPFTADGQVNYEVAAKLAEHLVDNGSDGLVICGTTGESPTLSWAEEYQLFQVVKSAIANRGTLIAGTGSNSTEEAIAATEKAAALGVDGALLVVPYYNKPPQEGLYQHFKAVAEAVPELPIMLYNIPGRTGCNLEPDTVARLSAIANITALKAASGNLDQISQIRYQTPPDFLIYSGDDSLTLPILSIGGRGVVSVASHLVGAQLQQMIQAFQQGQTQIATDLHLKLLPLVKALFASTNPIPVKTALALQGWELGPTRLPLCPLPASLQTDLQKTLKDLNLI